MTSAKEFFECLAVEPFAPLLTVEFLAFLFDVDAREFIYYTFL